MAKRFLKFISSMRFAIALLVLLAAACSVSSFVTQGQTYEWYARQYSERAAVLIMALRLDDAFHSAWFIAITAFLCVNLLLCSVTRLPRLIRRARAEADPAAALRGADSASVGGISDPAPVFERLRMPRPASVTTDEGQPALFAAKHGVGIWGAWVCHLGILLLILGFGLGQMTQQSFSVYGVPGQSKPIGETGLVLNIDDFTVGLRDDDTVEQYTADITVYNLTGHGEASKSARVSVNHPAALYGMKFYQNSTGWAARVNVQKSGEALQS